MRNWLYQRILAPMFALLRQGVSPSQLALCVSIGIVVGNIPIVGVSTILCSLIALLFRLNLAAMQLVQAAMAPSQLLLIIPFVRLGELILRDPPQPLSLKAGMQLLASGLWQAVHTLWSAIVHAGFAWLLLAPCAIFLLYKLLTPVFERTARQFPRRSMRGATS